MLSWSKQWNRVLCSICGHIFVHCLREVFLYPDCRLERRDGVCKKPTFPSTFLKIWRWIYMISCVQVPLTLQMTISFICLTGIYLMSLLHAITIISAVAKWIRIRLLYDSVGQRKLPGEEPIEHIYMLISLALERPPGNTRSGFTRPTWSNNGHDSPFAYRQNFCRSAHPRVTATGQALRQSASFTMEITSPRPGSWGRSAWPWRMTSLSVLSFSGLTRMARPSTAQTWIYFHKRCISEALQICCRPLGQTWWDFYISWGLCCIEMLFDMLSWELYQFRQPFSPSSSTSWRNRMILFRVNIMITGSLVFTPPLLPSVRAFTFSC